jgi:hypothetical protein
MRRQVGSNRLSRCAHSFSCDTSSSSSCDALARPQHRGLLLATPQPRPHATPPPWPRATPSRDHATPRPPPRDLGSVLLNPDPSIGLTPPDAGVAPADPTPADAAASTIGRHRPDGMQQDRHVCQSLLIPSCCAKVRNRAPKPNPSMLSDEAASRIARRRVPAVGKCETEHRTLT